MKIFSWLGKHISDVNVKDEPEGMNLPPTHQEWSPYSDKTVGEIIDTLTEEQKSVVYALIGQALETDRERKDDDRQ